MLFPIIDMTSVNCYILCIISTNPSSTSIVYDAIFERVNDVLKSLPAEVANDVYNTAIVFVGGGSKIAGLYEYAKSKIDFPIIVADEPADAVVLGLGKLLAGDKDFLKITL